MDWQRQMLDIFASVQNIHSYSLYTSNFIHCRYLARAVLVPFAYKAPPVTTDSLEDILTNAPAAIPDAIQIGQDVVAVDSSTLNNMAEQIKDVLETSRYRIPKVPLGERVCKLCNNDKVETEFYFVMECSKLQTLRNELFFIITEEDHTL